MTIYFTLTELYRIIYIKKFTKICNLIKSTSGLNKNENKFLIKFVCAYVYYILPLFWTLSIFSAYKLSETQMLNILINSYNVLRRTKIVFDANNTSNRSKKLDV